MRTTMQRGGRVRAFTLIELLAVIAILGLIAAFAVPQVLKWVSGANSATSTSRTRKAKLETTTWSFLEEGIGLGTIARKRWPRISQNDKRLF